MAVILDKMIGVQPHRSHNEFNINSRAQASTLKDCFRSTQPSGPACRKGEIVPNRAGPAVRDNFPKRLHADAASSFRRAAFGLGAGAASASTFGLRPSPIFTASSLRFAA